MRLLPSLAACSLAAAFFLQGCATDAQLAYWSAACEAQGITRDTPAMEGCIEHQHRQASAAAAASMSMIPRQVTCRQIGAFVQCN